MILRIEVLVFSHILQLLDDWIELFVFFKKIFLELNLVLIILLLNDMVKLTQHNFCFLTHFYFYLLWLKTHVWNTEVAFSVVRVKSQQHLQLVLLQQLLKLVSAVCSYYLLLLLTLPSLKFDRKLKQYYASHYVHLLAIKHVPLKITVSQVA